MKCHSALNFGDWNRFYMRRVTEVQKHNEGNIWDNWHCLTDNWISTDITNEWMSFVELSANLKGKAVKTHYVKNDAYYICQLSPCYDVKLFWWHLNLYGYTPRILCQPFVPRHCFYQQFCQPCLLVVTNFTYNSKTALQNRLYFPKPRHIKI